MMVTQNPDIACKMTQTIPVLWPLSSDSAHVNAEEAARGSGEHQEQAVQALELECRLREEFGAMPKAARRATSGARRLLS